MCRPGSRPPPASGRGAAPPPALVSLEPGVGACLVPLPSFWRCQRDFCSFRAGNNVQRERGVPVLRREAALGVWDRGKALVRPASGRGEGAEADAPMHQARGTDDGWKRLGHRHLYRAWAGAAHAGGSGVMSRRSLPCWGCRGGSRSAPGLRRGLCAQRPTRSRGKQAHLGLSPRRPASPEVPEPGGAGAALSPVPREAGRASRSWGQRKGEVLKGFRARQSRLRGQTGREVRSGHLSRIF